LNVGYLCTVGNGMSAPRQKTKGDLLLQLVHEIRGTEHDSWAKHFDEAIPAVLSKLPAWNDTLSDADFDWYLSKLKIEPSGIFGVFDGVYPKPSSYDLSHT